MAQTCLRFTLLIDTDGDGDFATGTIGRVAAAGRRRVNSGSRLSTLTQCGIPQFLLNSIIGEAVSPSVPSGHGMAPPAAGLAWSASSFPITGNDITPLQLLAHQPAGGGLNEGIQTCATTAPAAVDTGVGFLLS